MRPLAEQHEEWTAHLRRQVVSRRTVVRGAVGAAAGSLLLGSGRWADQAVAATLAGPGPSRAASSSTGGTCPSARTRPPRCGPGGQVFSRIAGNL